MRIAISGTSGLIGRALTELLRDAGHEPVALVRSRDRARAGDVLWNAETGEVDAEALARVDAVVHLAGEPIGAKRWSAEQKQRILESRTKGTQLLATAMAGLADGPRILVQGSAVGYYGDRGDELLTEESSAGDDYLAGVCVAWEAAAAPAVEAGIRVAYARTGVVIAPDGALIEKVRLPFSLGVGGVIGDGSQWVPWIALEDEVRALQFLVEHEVSGPVNLTAQVPVTNRELTEAIGTAMHRPTVIPTPIFGIRALYGEMGVTLATSSQRIRPVVLEEAGFTWQATEILGPLQAALA